VHKIAQISLGFHMFQLFIWFFARFLHIFSIPGIFDFPFRPAQEAEPLHSVQHRSEAGMMTLDTVPSGNLT
jgi:hypothetical protein